jgi:aryl-alcohol dehydrogenase-like predicted oxidoreductase
VHLLEVDGLEKKCSQLVLGTDYYKPEIAGKVFELMDTFVKIGGNTIDTAHIYAGGKSETVIGMWMKERKNREDIVILTKGAHHNQHGPRVNPQAIRDDLFTSLERLGTDYIDLYALHRDDPNIPVSVIMDALNEHIQAGRIRAIGASNWTWQRLQEANDYAKSNGLRGFAFSSINLSLAKANEPWWAGCVSADNETLDWHEKTQMPLFSWSSQARGFFSGRFTPDKPDDKDVVRVFFSDDNWERLRRAEQLAKERGVSTIQIALAYVLNQPFPAGALIGPQSVDEMMSSHAGTNIRLTQDELRWLDLRSR